jgi:hypothetical protein
MLSRTLIFLLLFLGFQSLIAQEQVDCKYLIEDAREAYDAGMVELVPELLLECIKTNGLTGELRKEAYKLVIQSYLFDLRLEEADTLMYAFVHEFPEYQVENEDPQEFVYMLEEQKTAMEQEISQIPADTIPEGPSKKELRREKRENNLKPLYDFGNTVGFNTGSIFSFPQTIEGYSVGDPALDESHFGMLPGLIIGGQVNLILNRKMEASSEFLYSVSRFSYKATPLTFTSYRYVEAQHQLRVPLSVLYKLNPDERKYCFYLKGGIVPGYLLHASGKGTRSYDAPLNDLVVERTDITESRNRFNLDVMIGGGIRIPFNKAYFFLETRVTSGILKANREGSSYQDNDLTWLLYHVGSDFRIHQLSISAGFCWDLIKQ